MDYKIFEDIPELQKEVDEAYKELNQATVNNDREKIDEQLPKVSELSNKLNDRLKDVQEYVDSHDIDEYRVRVDQAKESLEAAKKQGNQEEYDFAVANLEFAEKYLADLEKIRGLLPQDEEKVEEKEETIVEEEPIEEAIVEEQPTEETAVEDEVEENKRKINLERIKAKAAYYYELRKNKVKEKLSEEPVDYGDMTTDLKEDMIAFLNLQEVRERVLDRIVSIQDEIDDLFLGSEEQEDENLEDKYIQVEELENRLKAQYIMRDLVTKVIQDYERSLSVIPRSKLNQYLERIKEDQEYQSHKEENVDRILDNIDNNFDFNDNVNDDLEESLTRDIQKAELKYITNRNKSKETQRLLKEVEAKAFEEFDNLIGIYKSISNKDIPSRYRENINSKIKSIGSSISTFRNNRKNNEETTPEDNHIDIDYSVVDNDSNQEFDSKDLAELERMSLKSEARIDELQERIKELEEEKRVYDEQAKECCDEIIAKSQELKELMERNASKEERDNNKEERTKSLSKLDFANSKIDEYQELINQLNQEIDEEQKELDSITEQINTARETNVDQNDNDINVNLDLDNNNIVATSDDDSSDQGDNDSQTDQSDVLDHLGEDIEPSVDNQEPEDNQDFDDDDDYDEEYDPTAMDELRIPGIINKLVTDPETGDPISVSKIDKIIVDSSKISVKQKFAKEFVTDAAIYGVFAFASCAIKAIPYIIDKAVSKLKLLLNPASKVKLEKVAKNYDTELTEEEKEILLRKFKNNVANSDRSVEGILSVIREKNDQRIRETKISKRKEKVVNLYNKLLTNYNEAQEIKLMIDSLSNGDITIEEICETLKIEKTDELTREGLIERLSKKREKILSTACKDISKFYQLNSKLRELYDGGIGVHSNTESIRAIESRVNQRKTVRFGKDISTAEGVELREKIDELGQILDLAVAQNDNEAALKAFVGIQQENKKAEEVGMTFIRVLKGNLFPAGIPIIPVGRGHVGVGNFDPVSHEMDYRTDPFVRQVLTFAGTMVTLTAAVNNFMENYGLRRVAEEQRALEEKLHTQGEQLQGYDDELIDGMKAQDSLMISGDKNFHELNDTYWTDPGNYLVNDPAHHQELAELYSTTQSSYQEIADLLSTGQITPLEAAERHAEITSTLEEITHELFESAKPGMEEYMRNHPQFDYSALHGAIEEFERNPNSLTAENNALMEAIRIGEDLATTAVTTAKPHWLHDMIGVLGALTLAHQANKTFGDVPQEEPVSLAELVDKSIELDEKIAEANESKEKTDDVEDMLNEEDNNKSKEGKSTGKH